MLGDVLHVVMNMEETEVQHQVHFDSVNNVSSGFMDCDVYNLVVTKMFKSCLFSGIGGDTTVGVNMTPISIISDQTDDHSQPLQ